jgi:hypothetical protein
MRPDGPELIRTLLSEGCDMVVGTRRGVTDDAGRRGHAFGNSVFNTLYKTLFGPGFHRHFLRLPGVFAPLCQELPGNLGRFRDRDRNERACFGAALPVAELPLDYGRRPEGSHSKLSTFKDGAKILWMFAMLMKETRPFMFFGYISVFTLALSMMFMVPVLNEYFLTGLVTRMPTWVLAMALMMMALMIFSGGRDPRFACPVPIRAEAVSLHVDFAVARRAARTAGPGHRDRTGISTLCADGRKAGAETQSHEKHGPFSFAGAIGFRCRCRRALAAAAVRRFSIRSAPGCWQSPRRCCAPT